MPRLLKHPCVHCRRAVGRLQRCRHCGAVQRVRDYVITRVLSVGPRGRVYLAQRDGEQLALKELAFATVPNVNAIDQFERECDVLSRLSHPLLPRFVESFEEGAGVHRRMYLAQSYVPGESLETRLAHHVFDEREARRIASDVLSVLEYLHSRSPRHIHRDIKPANIIARPDASFVLVDFGSVRLSGAEESSHSIAGGTFGYMPPEQLTREADERSDLYALGMTLARILSRRRPEELLTRASESFFLVDFRRHVNVSQGFVEFIHRLVAFERAARFGDAASARRALLHLSGSTMEVPALQKWAPSPQPSERVEQPRSEALPVKRVQPWRMRIGTEYVTLEPGKAYVVGREDDCDIRIDERLHRANTVSRHHLRLTVIAAGLEIEELGSTNGTFAGETFLRTRGTTVTLKHSTQLQMGRVVTEVAPRPHGSELRDPNRADRHLLGYHGGDPNGVRILIPEELRRFASSSSRS